jgi:hypothetical protein
VTGATGSASTSVTWNATCGSLSSTTANPVTYTAPALAENCIVTATSVADTAKSGQATVTVATPGTVNIFLTPASASIPAGGSVQITATVTGFANTVYSEPSTATANYVAGLTPNPGYTVTKSAAAGNTQVTITTGGTTAADNAGVLKFRSVCGCGP